MQIWTFGKLVHELIHEHLKLIQNFQKNEVVTGKNLFFVIGPFWTHHSIGLNISFWYGSFAWNGAFSAIVLSTKKRYASFLKKMFIFDKICFKVRVLKTVCRIKTCQSLKGRVILKIPSTVFRKNLCSFSWL